MPQNGPAVTRATPLRRALGLSLEFKLLGANLIILALAALAHWGSLLNPHPPKATYLYIVGLALAAGGVANFILVRLALRPITDLQRVAKSVASGHLGDRVPASPVADRDLAQLAVTMNEMLDSLAADRERIRRMAGEVVYAQESERTQIADDLHDTVAENLSAVSFQLASLANEFDDRPGARSRITELRERLRISIEGINHLSRTLHPRVADDLSLPAALESLALSTQQRSGLNVTVKADLGGVLISSTLRKTLYTVAEQALRDIETQGDAVGASILAYGQPGVVELEVTADWSGPSLEPGANRVFSSLDAVRERLVRDGGQLRIERTSSGSTRILATVKTEVIGDEG